MKRYVSSVFLFLFFLYSTAVFSNAQTNTVKSELTFEQIFNKTKNLNPEMKDCQAKLAIKINAKTFITIRLNLDGDFYYKAKDKFKINLKRTPAYLQKHPQIFSWQLPNTKEYNTSVDAKEDINGAECYVLTLKPKQEMGDLLLNKIWINALNFTIAKQSFNYKNNGYIEVFQNYKKINDFWIFDNIKANFSFPKIRLNAEVNAFYSDYKFNQNLPDSLFK